MSAATERVGGGDSERLLVAVDIGNTSIVLGFFLGQGLRTLRMPTHPLMAPAEYRELIRAFLKENDLEKKSLSGIISSVVPPHTAVLRETLGGLPGADREDILTVNHGMDSGLVLKVRSPEELGTDRIADAAGAAARYGVPVVVADLGTATTITVVDRHAGLVGGAIMPGIALMSDVLGEKTARLSGVSLEKPESPLGRDTAGCIRTGLFIGTAGAVERILEDIEGELSERLRVIVTGGFGAAVASFLRREYVLDEGLTLEGLRVLYERNRHA